MGTAHTWEEEGFKVKLQRDSMNPTGEYGKPRYRYSLQDGGRRIFGGNDLESGATGDALVADLLGFLTVGPDDVEAAYFARYTPAQIAWRDSDRREELAWLASDLEERLRRI